MVMPLPQKSDLCKGGLENRATIHTFDKWLLLSMLKKWTGRKRVCLRYIYDYCIAPKLVLVVEDKLNSLINWGAGMTVFVRVLNSRRRFSLTRLVSIHKLAMFLD